MAEIQKSNIMEELTQFDFKLRLISNLQMILKCLKFNTIQLLKLQYFGNYHIAVTFSLIA